MIVAVTGIIQGLIDFQNLLIPVPVICLIFTGIFDYLTTIVNVKSILNMFSSDDLQQMQQQLKKSKLGR